MKKLVLVFLAVVMALSISGCRFGGAADYTAQEISELIRGGLSEGMTHEDLFNKFDSLGFDKIDDIIVSTDMHSKVFDRVLLHSQVSHDFPSAQFHHFQTQRFHHRIYRNSYGEK